MITGSIRQLLCCLPLLLAACSDSPVQPNTGVAGSFTLAVIPDTQNYLDYQHQLNEGFALDGTALFMAQMQDIANRDDVAFVAAVGDVWQHYSLTVDPDHAARGLGAIENPYLAARLAPTPKTRSVEMPSAVEGYKLLHHAGIPFGVAPGNHDYDAIWNVEGYPARLDKPLEQLSRTPADLGALHVGGLDNFRSVFGASSTFFRDQDWYVDSYHGGASSAQLFSAGGYQFLHITLQMSPDSGTLEWAAAVIRKYPHRPTIITTHDYLDTRGRRKANPMLDLAAIDPDYHNSAEQVWERLISAYDQIFMVLCGHYHGQAYRVDTNHYGHKVHQLLANYQGRGQAGLDAGQPLKKGSDTPPGLGDGWYRLLNFKLDSDPPVLEVETWSSHYRVNAGELDSYADWYRNYEQPQMSNAEFLSLDEFSIELEDFKARFGPPRY